MNKNRVLYTLLICLLSNIILSDTLWSQVNPEVQARQQLASRGISEEELTLRLAEKGINIEDLKNMSPAEAMEVQEIIEATITEMEQEKVAEEFEPEMGNDEEVEKDKDNKEQSSATKESQIDTIPKLDPLNIEGEIYGQHIFLGRSLPVYNQSKDVRPSEDYILGPGDEIFVSIWGYSRLEESLEVSADGFVFPGRMPRVYVKGFTLKQVRALLRKTYGRYYRFSDNEYSIALKFSRVINVNIFGEVNNYGGFTMPAVNTAFNALVAAGGPTDIGSVRRIRVIRGREVKELDTYKFLSDMVYQPDHYLQNNDIIQVPVAQSVVEVRGLVQRPYKYEMLDGEGLKDLIKYAGGLKKEALQKKILVKRFENDEQITLDVDYSELLKSSQNFPLKNGDLILVDSIAVFDRNVINVSGAVSIPGEYELPKDKMLSSLLSRIGLGRESRTDVAFIKRSNPDGTFGFFRTNLSEVLKGAEDFQLQGADELIIYGLAEFVDVPTFEVEGAVRNPSEFEYTYNTRVRVEDAVIMAGGLTPDADRVAYVIRQDSSSYNELQYIRLDIRDALQNPNGPSNIQIMPNDILSIGSLIEKDQSRFVDVAGAVRKPGRFEFGQGMTLRDAIDLAGGFAFNAASNRIDVFRVKIEDNEPTKTIVATAKLDRDLNFVDGDNGIALFPYDQVYVREVPEFEFQRNITIKGEVRYPGTYAIAGDNERLVTAIERAGGLTPEAFVEGATLFREMDSIGYVVIDLSEAMSKANSRHNILLKEGDEIEVPKQRDLVRIIGFTNAAELYPDRILSQNNGIAVPFHPGRNAKYYIDEYAAGVGENGDACSVTVEHANGQIEFTRNYGLFKSYPKVKKGSVIRVGQKTTEEEKKKAEEKEDVDWGKIFANSVAQATTILSLILLLQRID